MDGGAGCECQQLVSDQGLQGRGCLRCQQLEDQCGCECASTSEAQARLAGEQVKWSGRSRYRSVWPPQGPGGFWPTARELCVRETHCTGNWSGTAASGVGTSRCKQLGRPGSRGSSWAGCVSELSCCRDPHWNFISIPDIYIYII